mmetsp:Transcript_20161/g.80462  ORF Transcript_20161/g.80462 Transcript_20161/m.80462 type:complete len:412 (+) Transcript_20161:1098-2333(+)
MGWSSPSREESVRDEFEVIYVSRHRVAAVGDVRRGLRADRAHVDAAQPVVRGALAQAREPVAPVGEEAREKRDARRRELAPRLVGQRQVLAPLEDLATRRRGVLGEERRVPDEALVHDHPERPPVARLAVPDARSGGGRVRRPADDASAAVSPPVLRRVVRETRSVGVRRRRRHGEDLGRDVVGGADRRVRELAAPLLVAAPLHRLRGGVRVTAATASGDHHHHHRLLRSRRRRVRRLVGVLGEAARARRRRLVLRTATGATRVALRERAVVERRPARARRLARLTRQIPCLLAVGCLRGGSSVGVVVGITVVVVVVVRIVRTVRVVIAQVVVVDAFAEAEIGQFDVAVPVDEHVVGFQVAVRVAVVVDGGHGLRDLRDVEPRRLFGERVDFDEQRHEVATGEELHHHVQI